MTHHSDIQSAIAERNAGLFVEKFCTLRDKAAAKRLLKGLETAAALVLQDPYAQHTASAFDMFEDAPSATDWGQAIRSGDTRVIAALDYLWGVQSLNMDAPWPQAQVYDALALLPSVVSLSLDLEEAQLGPLAEHSPQLVHLHIEGCMLASHEDDLCRLVNLQTLNLKGNALASIPACIGELQALVSLDLSRNQLSDLPVDIGMCRLLERLDISHNPLKALPHTVAALTHLKTASLGHLELAAGQSIDFGNWPELESLSIPAAGIQDFRTLDGLHHLHSLDIAQNTITHLPQLLTALTSLTISSDQLPAMVEWLAQQSSLSALIIHGGGVPIAIHSLASLPHLRILRIDHAPIDSLDGIETFDQLHELSLIGNGLLKIPTEMGKLKHLQLLRVEQNPIQEIPNVFGGFEHLQAVHLSHNQLESLPDSLLLNWSIRILNAYGNPFSPERLADMQLKGRRI
jgi:Leucine-rich repeat (LRR) protein